MVCLIWIYKRLYILLYSNNKYIVVFIDYKAIYNIVNVINLNILSIDYINRRLINVSIYLLVYPFNIYYMFGWFNFIPDVFFYLRTLRDNTIRTNETVEFVLNIV